MLESNKSEVQTMQYERGEEAFNYPNGIEPFFMWWSGVRVESVDKYYMHHEVGMNLFSKMVRKFMTFPCHLISLKTFKIVGKFVVRL